MKIVFMGTPEFAVASLDALVNSKHEVVGVVTVADKAAGRGKKIRYSAVKEYALEHNIALFQPEKLRDDSFTNDLVSLNADVFVVVAFRMLPKSIWSIPNNGTFNIHASLLPQYRGAAPINHAIINNEKESGLTTFLIDEEIDTGNIILQKKVDISPEDDAGDLHDKLMELSREIVIDTCEIIEKGNINLIPQKQLIDSELKSAPKIFKQHCHIETNSAIEKAHNLVRGLSPYPASFVQIVSPEGKEFVLKIFKTKVENKGSKAGKIYTDNKTFLSLGLNDGQLKVIEMQLQGKKRMPIEDFLRGFNISEEWKWQ